MPSTGPHVAEDPSRRELLRAVLVALPVTLGFSNSRGCSPAAAAAGPEAEQAAASDGERQEQQQQQQQLLLEPLSLSNGTVEILAPKTWFRSVRDDGVVVGDFRSTSILTVKILDAGPVFSDLLLTRSGMASASPRRGRAAPRMMWDGLGTSLDLANLFLSYRDYAAAVGGQQVSSATKVSVLPGADFGVDSEVLQLDLLVRLEKSNLTIGSTRSNNADTSSLVVPLILSGKSRGRLELAAGYKPERVVEEGASAAQAEASAPPSAGATQNSSNAGDRLAYVIERAGTEFIIYHRELQRVIIASFTAPEEVYDSALAHQLCSSLRIVPPKVVK
ncbi:hypothetical protein FVE85_3389 [Porphyridium purpureum]|uniref:Uncharacterized protein n=1 Tax=Porphyridium purpureum TaxID=35688 RepID=A0A5J4YVC1_PORPP|nr:hypothetical protein FVE85_3389 [Porphyridium purpureum]|eukprot:POR7938..scf227_4